MIDHLDLVVVASLQSSPDTRLDVWKVINHLALAVVIYPPELSRDIDTQRCLDLPAVTTPALTNLATTAALVLAN